MAAVALAAAAACGGGSGGGKLEGAGDCTSAARAEVGIKDVKEVPAHLGDIVRRVVLARSVGIEGQAPPADLVACVADSYRRNEEALFAVWRDGLREWASRTATDLSASLTGGTVDVHDALDDVTPDVRVRGRDLGYTAGVLSEAGKVAGDDKDKTEDLLGLLERCPQAILFVALRNDRTFSQRLFNADAKYPQPTVLDGPGNEVYPTSNAECNDLFGRLYGPYDDNGGGLSLVDVVLVLHGDLVEDHEQLYRSELLDRLRPRS